MSERVISEMERRPARSETGDTAESVPATSPGEGILIQAAPHACVGCGDLSEFGLRLKIHHVPGGCWADLVVPERFQGWEGVTHGGIVSTILDEVMSWSLIDRDLWGLTARLTVNFKRPVLVGREIHAEGRLLEVRRRVVTTSGRLVEIATGVELATAEATYVAVDEAKKALLQERYGDLGGRLEAAQREARAGAGAPAGVGEPS